MDRKRLAMAAAMVGNGIFGFSFMFSRMALDEAQPFVMLAYRFLFAFAAINVVILLTRRRTQAGKGIDWLRFSLRGRRFAPLIALGVVQPVCYFLCESYGISLTNSVFAGVIIALVPIAALFFGALFLHEKPKGMQIAFSALSIVGVMLMTMQQSAEGDIHPLGILLLVGAVLSGVMFNVISRGISDSYSALERTYVMMLVAAVFFCGGCGCQLLGECDGFACAAEKLSVYGRHALFVAAFLDCRVPPAQLCQQRTARGQNDGLLQPDDGDFGVRGRHFPGRAVYAALPARLGDDHPGHLGRAEGVSDAIPSSICICALSLGYITGT